MSQSEVRDALNTPESRRRPSRWWMPSAANAQALNDLSALTWLMDLCALESTSTTPHIPLSALKDAMYRFVGLASRPAAAVRSQMRSTDGVSSSPNRPESPHSPRRQVSRGRRAIRRHTPNLASPGANRSPRRAWRNERGSCFRDRRIRPLCHPSSGAHRTPAMAGVRSIGRRVSA
jgi:hypothetical protein